MAPQLGDDLPPSQPWAVPPSWWKPDSEPPPRRLLHEHDIDEIVYQHAFRRMEQKTQVIVQPSSNTFRTRLSHTLEVARIASNISTAVHLNGPLTQAIALGHDIGHPPFAHIGERTLDRLIKDYVKRSSLAYGANRKQADELSQHFSFLHTHNSRRVLQRKTSGLSSHTLCGVIGHGWSPWKDCSDDVTSAEEVEAHLLRPLPTAAQTPNHAPTDCIDFLKCYEAQAVAIADQLAGLNSDVEDLVNLASDTRPILSAAEGLLDRLTLIPSLKEAVRNRLRDFVHGDGDGAEARRRGWGRKERLGRTVRSVVKFSISRVREVLTPEGSILAPLAPESDIAITLDVLERVTRAQIQAHSGIRERDAIAESAMTIMFGRLLALESSDPLPERDQEKKRLAGMGLTESFAAWYVKNRGDHAREVAHEKPDAPAISHPGMRDRANGAGIDGLWDQVSKYIMIADMISEMSDRFVIYRVFGGDRLGYALRQHFDPSGPSTEELT